MWKRLILAVLVAAFVRHMITFIKILGLEKTIYNVKPGECHFVRGIEHGSEDLELLSDGIVIVSEGYLTFKDRVEGAPRGHLFAYDINNHNKGAIELKIKGDYDVNTLHPHGITAFEDKTTAKTFIFVINHHVGFDVVDIFEFDRNTMSLSFIKSKRDPLIRSVNNLIATGPESFFITNEANFLHPRMRFLEDTLLLRSGYILFCDVTGCKQVSESLNNPNGIDLSRDGRLLYVSQPFARQIRIYERNLADNSLTPNKGVDVINLGTTSDNIYVDESGDIWAGCIKVPSKALHYMNTKQGIVPSQVLRIRVGSDDYEMSEVYSEDGRNITMSTSAIYHRGVLLIGSLHERMMRCQVTTLI
ncbi:serum paraoxonase/arylesterase 1-like [Lytechinus variegatus]|uniref:serum paraoxonase/arylesterase 1-like n=1 Tax=Lytechinus variegatus TaxID=7654 RepID=UPI001BB1027D|nr:serum paraoxonase/arylesterase 1-like [Lytechinus variegatus]